MSRPVKIAFLDARYHTFYGAQRSLFTLVTNLDTKRTEPVVLLPGEGKLAEKYRSVGLEVAVLPLKGEANAFGGRIPRLSWWGKTRVGLALLRYNVQVAHWLKENKIDVVYANDVRSLLYVALAGKYLRIPLLWYVRADGRPSFITRIGLWLADRVILIAHGVNTLFTRSDYRKHYTKFVTLYTGFDLDFPLQTPAAVNELRWQNGIPVGVPVIGIVSSINDRKGHDLLIQALGILESDGVDAHLVVVGDSPVGHEPYRESLNEIVVSLGLSPRVHWLGYQSDVIPLYQMMDVLALPSRSEGLPRVLIEGLAAGVPVVASDVGGVKEIVTSKEMGTVVPPDDANSLARALREVLRDSTMHTPEARQFRSKHVRDRFTIESYIRGFERIIKTVA